MGEFCINKVFDSYELTIDMACFPTYENKSNGTFIWGYSICGRDCILNDEWNEASLNKCSGYFFALRIHDDKIEIVNDFLAGYRIYYIQDDDKIIFSDNWETSVSDIEQKRNLEVDKEQLEYWKKHRYTLGNSTLFQGVQKLLPASHIKINNSGIIYDTYYIAYERHSNYKRFIDKGLENITKQLEEIKKEIRSKILLFYSGGADSTLLLKLCIELSLPIKCIVIKYLPEWSVNKKDQVRAINNLNSMGVDYDLVEVNLENAAEKYGGTLVDDMLFNRHMGVHFYATYNAIAQKYGNDVIIINGQSADSILSFGPSEYTIGNMLKRMILAFSRYKIWIPLNCVCKLLKQRYLMPTNKEEAYFSMLDDTNYKFLLDTKCNVKEMIIKKIKAAEDKGISQYEAMRMYLKIISFLQGSDNQIVLKAANSVGISKVIMPFTSPEFIYSVVKYKNNIIEIFKPKYFVRDILKYRFGYKGEKNTKIVMLTDDFDIETLENRINKLYDKKIRELV